MSIEFAIQPVMHGPGYEVVRTADDAVLTTVATAGEASQYIHNLELERRYDDLKSGAAYMKPSASDRVWEAIDALIEDEPTLPANPSPQLLDLVGWVNEHVDAERDMDAYINDGLAKERANPNMAMRQLNGTNGCMSMLVARYGMAGAAARLASAAERLAREAEAELPSHLRALRAQIDAETDPATRRRLICRMADQVLGLSDDEPSEALTPILEDIERHFALPPAETAIEVKHLYYDPRNHNDITDKPVGPLAYTDYALGADDTHVFISFDARGVLQLVSMFGHDPVDINDALGALANLQALLNDPRVQALRTRQ